MEAHNQRSLTSGRRLPMRLCWCAVALVVAVLGVTSISALDVEDIVRRYAQAEAANARAQLQYGYREHSVQQLINKAGENDGTPTSETWEVKGIEGRPYRRSALSSASSRNDDGVWLPQTVLLKFDMTFIKIDRVHGRVAVTYSNYRKF